MKQVYDTIDDNKNSILKISADFTKDDFLDSSSFEVPPINLPLPIFVEGLNSLVYDPAEMLVKEWIVISEFKFIENRLRNTLHLCFDEIKKNVSTYFPEFHNFSGNSIRRINFEAYWSANYLICYFFLFANEYISFNESFVNDDFKISFDVKIN